MIFLFLIMLLKSNMNRHRIFVTFPTCCLDNLQRLIKQEQLINLKLSVKVVLADFQSKAQAEITLAVCFLLASDVTRNIAASLAFQFFSLSA